MLTDEQIIGFFQDDEDDGTDSSALRIGRVIEQAVIAAERERWRPIETAPRGSGKDGPRDTRAPDYVPPPAVLLWTDEGAVVGYYDWYYHEGYGSGAEPGVSAWRTSSGEQTYGATHWMPLPAKPII